MCRAHNIIKLLSAHTAISKSLCHHGETLKCEDTLNLTGHSGVTAAVQHITAGVLPPPTYSMENTCYDIMWFRVWPDGDHVLKFQFLV